MPQIETIPSNYYTPDQPYHWLFDNLPLAAINERLRLVNAAVDIDSDNLRWSAGTQGSLANRLAQSIDDDGNLKKTAVDEAAHGMSAHTDDTATLANNVLDALKTATGITTLTNPVGYVRMLSAERAKLASLASGATALKLRVVPDPAEPDDFRTFSSETVELISTDSITWSYTNDNKLTATMPISQHRHLYGSTPTLVSGTTYKVDSGATPYVSGSLRVYVNGLRLAPASYTEDDENGRFTLLVGLQVSDSILIDYDVSLN